MVFNPFKTKKCLVTDDLFLALTWIEGKSPEDDSELLGVIEDLDQRYLEDFKDSIEDSLPYLTFQQAELLFQELSQVYGSFQLKKVAVCHLEGREAVSEGEVFSSPFLIERDYQNLLVPLIQSILTEESFHSYSYQDKREYFIDQVYPAYKTSLGVPESSLPLFPEDGEVIAAVPAALATPSAEPVRPEKTKDERKKVSQTNLKRLHYLIGGLGTLLAICLLLLVAVIGRLNNQTEKVNYLYQQVKSTKSLVESEHQVDLFSRYFLPNYYSGQKEKLVNFLSNGNAKYTVPKEGNLVSVILEKITYDAEKKTYQVTYVLALKQEEETKSIRLTFDVQQSDSSKYGFEVVTEPKETDYAKPKNNKEKDI